MARFYDLDEANAAIPEVRTILESLRDQRAELIRLRDEVLAHAADDEVRGEGRGDATTEAKIDADVRVLRLRMQGVIDRMQAGVVRIDEMGITLREIETGLIDFPALASGRQIWLCWRLGEDDVGWWHELAEGFGNRHALADARAGCGNPPRAARLTLPPGRARTLQGGRAKAYRPIPAADRRRAFEQGVAAYDRGDFFEAHELLEPAWMGTADIPERDLLQGLIKLAAAFVHGVRGNPMGI